MDNVFLKFKSFVQELVSPIFTFQMKRFAWYQKAGLIDLTLKIALMNCYAEGLANALRKQKTKRKNIPTSETLLDYLKTQNLNDTLKTAKTLIAKCETLLVRKGLVLTNVAIAFDWHDVRFYGKHNKEGVEAPSLNAEQAMPTATLPSASSRPANASCLQPFRYNLEMTWGK